MARGKKAQGVSLEESRERGQLPGASVRNPAVTRSQGRKPDKTQGRD